MKDFTLTLLIRIGVIETKKFQLRKFIIGISILFFTALSYSQNPWVLTDFVDQNVSTSDSELDWEDVWNGNLPMNAISSGIIFDDLNNPDDPIPNTFDKVFTEGSKDDQLISEWMNSNNGPNDKTDIQQAGAFLYEGVLYFFGNLYAANGDANIGFWFFQDKVAAEGFAFTGEHLPGDLFIVAAFSNGGKIDNIAAYEWVGDGSGDEPNSSNNLKTLIPANTESTLITAVVNENSEPTPWKYFSKNVNGPTNMPPLTFFEGYIDLRGLALDGTIALASDFCFSSFMVNTRTSTSVDASLKDFIGDSFDVTPDADLEGATICLGDNQPLLDPDISGGLLKEEWDDFLYKWYRNGVEIPGEEGPTYQVDENEPGTYTFGVQVIGDAIDGLGLCPSEIAEADVIIIESPNLTISANDITCNGDADGEIQIPANDYSLKLFKSESENGTYTLVVNPDLDIDGNYINLGPGWYYVEATDSVNQGEGEDPIECSADSNKVEITEPAAIVLVINGDAILCNGDADGNVTGTVSGGTAPYTVELSGDATDSQQVLADGGSYDFDELSGGDYTVTVKDANYTAEGGSGCSASKDASITEPAAIVLTINGDAILCSGDADGNVTGTVSGGTAPYTVELSGDATDSQQVLTAGGSYDFDELSGGNYTVTVKDANYTAEGGSGCSASKDASVTEAGEITLVVNGDTILCNGDADGNVTGTVSGGTAPYTVELSGDATDSQQVLADGGSYDFDELSGGDYTVTVKDANYIEDGGCSTSKDASITEPAAIVLVINGDAILCNGDADGNVTGTVSGGTAPYTVELSGDATDSQQVLADGGSYDFDELSGGDYTVTVKDANYTAEGGSGCSASKDASITEPAAIVLTINGDAILCSGDADGNVTGTVSGGTAPYTVELSGDATDSQQVLTAGGSYDFDELSGGNYTVTVKDANYTAEGGSGCSASKDASVTEAGEITLVVNGDTILCNGDADGNVTGTVSGGTAPYTVELSGDATDSQQVLADGGSYDFDELSGGDYTVTVKDANYIEDGGCSTSKDASITEPAAIVLVINGDAILCNGDADGNVTGTVSGGTAPYTVELSGDATDSQQVLADGGSYDFDELSGGDYTVTVKDANYTAEGGSGCSASKDASITEPAAIVLTINGDAILCSGDADGNVTGTVSGGTAPYTVELSGDATDSQQVLTAGGSYDFDELSGGNYTVTVKDANYTAEGGSGCSASKDASVTEAGEITLVVNGDTILCNGDADGNVTGTVSGGTAPYTVELSGDATDSQQVLADGGSYDFDELSGGDYTVTVKDANYIEDGGCSTSKDASITEPAAIVLVINGDAILCNGDADGNVTGTVSGGTAPYTVELSGDATDSQQVLADGGSYDFDELSGGDYTVTVKDANYTAEGGSGCSASKDASITEPDILDVQIDVQNISCPGFNDGIITFTASGGTPPYTSDYGDFDQNGILVLNNLTPGVYGTVITDANDCGLAIDGLVVSEPDEIIIPNIQPRQATCIPNAQGGVALSYNLEDGITQFFYSYKLRSEIAYSEYEEYLGEIALSPGIYDFKVKYTLDGCESDPFEVMIQRPPSVEFILNAEIIEPDCESGLGTVFIRINDNTEIDTGFFNYTISAASIVYYDGVKQPETGFSGLPPGDYTINAKTDNECDFGNTLVTLEEPECQEFEGCTLGYWKNHTDRWECYSTCTLYSEVFGIGEDNYVPSALQDKTLLEVLNQGGGGIYNLGRQSVAALLNICNGDVHYEILTEAELIMYVQDNFDNAGAAGTYLDELNNAGCTLGGSRATTEPSEGCDEPENDKPGKGKPAKNSSSVTSGFKASPVPFKERLTVQYDFEYISNVTIQVYDLRGQLLRTYKDRKVTKGDITELDVDFRMKANQVYILRVATDRDVFSKSVISAKK